LAGFHPLGTARADASPERGVVDGELKLHGVEGVYVADGSVVPSSLGVNPQLTIMALATRLALKLLS
jgi:choline dehydrogenase-like flavoprotein